MTNENNLTKVTVFFGTGSVDGALDMTPFQPNVFHMPVPKYVWRWCNPVVQAQNVEKAIEFTAVDQNTKNNLIEVVKQNFNTLQDNSKRRAIQFLRKTQAPLEMIVDNNIDAEITIQHGELIPIQLIRQFKDDMAGKIDLHFVGYPENYDWRLPQEKKENNNLNHQARPQFNKTNNTNHNKGQKPKPQQQQKPQHKAAPKVVESDPVDNKKQETKSTQANKKPSTTKKTTSKPAKPASDAQLNKLAEKFQA